MELKVSADLMNSVGFIVGILGVLATFWQMYTAKNTRKMYEEKCKTRCKDLVQTVGQLQQAVYLACKIKDEYFDDLMTGKCIPNQDIRPLRQLSDQIHSIDGSKNQLIRFCDRLNEEHLEEFGILIYKNISEEIDYFSHSRTAKLNDSAAVPTLKLD